MQHETILNYLSRRYRKWGDASPVAVFVLIHGVAFLVYGVVVLPQPGNYFSASTQIIIGLTLMSVLAAFIIDYLGLLSAWTDTATWDLLRLTPLDLETVVQMKYHLAQQRTWLIAVAVMTLRIVVVELMFVHVFVLPYLRWGYVNWRSVFNLSSSSPELIFIIPSLGILSASLIEPLWRMKAMTALSLAISPHMGDKMIGVVGTSLAVWAIQFLLIAIGVLLWVLVYPALYGATMALFYDFIDYFGIELLVAGWIFVVFVFTTLGGFFFYQFLKHQSLRMVRDQVF